MKTGQKGEGRNHSSAPVRNKSLSRGCRFCHWISHSSQVTALWRRRTDCSERRGEEGGQKKRLSLQNVCAGQGADVFGFSLAFVFKRQSTVKTKQNGHVPLGSSSDSFPCSFVSWQGVWNMKFQIVSREWFYKETNGWSRGAAWNGGGGQLLKLPAEWTAYRWIGPCGIRILSDNKADPL